MQKQSDSTLAALLLFPTLTGQSADLHVGIESRMVTVECTDLAGTGCDKVSH